MKHLVYETTNKVNGKTYIGVHSCRGASCTHWRSSTQTCGYLGSGIALKAAISKYGRNNFRSKVLHVCKSREEAIEIEKVLVKPECRSTYNLIEGGGLIPDTSVFLGRNISEETRAKISKTLTGRKLSKEHREAMKGRPSFWEGNQEDRKLI